MKFSEVIIIGAGPAGISAAIQLRRYGIEPLIFDKDEIGGLLRNANLVENYPGFPKGILGKSLVELFKKQFLGHDLEVIREEVINVAQEGKQFLIETTNEKYVSDFLVVASGTKPKLFSKLKFPESIQPYLHYEVHSLRNEKGKLFVIVGAGDAAFDYSLNLSKNNQVIILNRGTKTNCLPLLWERAKKNDSIKYYSNSEINGIKWSGSKLEVNVKRSEIIELIEADHVIFAIGRNLELGFLSSEFQKNFDDIEKQGNLFIIGDVKNGMFRQTSISVGDGVKAAMKIYNKKQESIK